MAITVDIRVGVALQRPPREDELRLIRVSAETPTEASLIAAQMAVITPPGLGFDMTRQGRGREMPGPVMSVSTEILDIRI